MKGLIIVAVFLVAASVCAETIRLANGREFEGTIIRSNSASISVRTRAGVSTYARSEIEGGTTSETPQVTPMHQPATPVRPGSDAEVMAAYRPFVRSFVRAAIGMKIAGFLGLLATIWLVIVGFRQSVMWGLFVANAPTFSA